MGNLKGLLGPMRVPFLILTPACVLVGIGTALWIQGSVNVVYAIVILIGALATHISVNAFNEYFDFKSGIDFQTKRTPFSGGSGTLPENPALEKQALATAIISLVIVGLVGIFFVSIHGWGLLPLGLLGMIVIFTYTPWIANHPLICLVAPGLGFGTFMVNGTHYALTGSYSWTAFIASLVPFFLVSDLLLLNQFPDVEADKTAGRRHYPIVIGRRSSSWIYNGFLLMSYVSILIGVLLNLLPPLSLLGLITIVLALIVGKRAYTYADDIPNLIPSMGLNVLINILTPVLVSVGLFFSS